MERTHLCQVNIGFESDIVQTRDMARRISGLLGLSSYQQTAVGTAVSEMVRYLISHCGTGEVEFAFCVTANSSTFLIEARGREIPTSQQGADSDQRGLGVKVLQRLADSFEVSRSSGQRLSLIFNKCVTSRVPADTIDKIRKCAVLKEPGLLLEELQLQNQQLIQTLDVLHKKQEELAGTRDALLHTNKMLQEANQLLEIRAVRDPLTGLFNRLKFNEMVEAERQRAHRYTFPLSLIILDIDKFKMINDRYGHTEGDRILREIADLVSVNIRENDLLFRWGGEEFVLLSPHCDIKDGTLLAEKIRSLIRAYHFGVDQVVTCSFGVAVLSDNESSENLFQRADEALYRAKGGGRDRVEVSLQGVEKNEDDARRRNGKPKRS